MTEGRIDPTQLGAAVRRASMTAPQRPLRTGLHFDLDQLDQEDPQAMTIARLHGDLDASKRIIWLLVHRLGGQVTLTDEEVSSVPQHPPLQLIEDGRQIIAEPYIAPQGG